MADDDEIEWHKEQIAKNQAVLAELEASNTSEDVFPETKSEIGRLKAQIAQSELIVAAYEKQPPKTFPLVCWPSRLSRELYQIEVARRKD